MTVPSPDLSDSLVLDLEVDALCSRYESAWQRGEHPDLDTQLPAGGLLRGKALAELVRLDLEYRLKAGEPVRVDTYLKRYPELQGDTVQAAQLFSDEQRCRTQLAEKNAMPPVCLMQTSDLGAGRETVTRTGETLNTPASTVFGLLAPPQEPGEMGRLGNYRILEVLGEGGMGLVLRAMDPNLHREVALKVMKPAIAADENARGRFLREARAAARLEHERIVAIYQVDEVTVRASKVLYLAMPLLRGESLESLLQRQPRLSLAEVLRIGREIAEGLAVAHAAGLVHRDIKPANLWLKAASPGAINQGEPGTSGHVQILDFGLARVEKYESELTQAGQVLGTPAYMAPEQAEGNPVDGRCDLFSLGCVLYRLTTGQMPFQGKNIMAILRCLAMHHPLPPRQIDPTIPEGLSDLVMHLLAKDPEARPGSAREVIEALRILERLQLFQAGAAVTVGLGVEKPAVQARSASEGLFLSSLALRAWTAAGIVLGVILVVALWRWPWGKGPANAGPDTNVALIPNASVGTLPGKDKATPDPIKGVPLSGKMEVRVWSNLPDGKKDLLICQERNGAIPVREDDLVAVNVSLNKPAYLYLIWVDAKGTIFPLYPWNKDKLEITDISVRPPLQQPRQQLRNPPRERSGWEFDNTPGLETIFLLANPTPLPDKVTLGDLIGALPPAPLRHPNEVIVRAFDRGQPVEELRLDVERGIKKEAQRIDDQLLALVEQLKDRFEVIRAVQFAHVPKAGP